MADSPLHENIDNVTYKLKVEGKEVPDAVAVVALEVDREVFRIPTAKITLLLPFPDKDNGTFALSDAQDYQPGKAVTIEGGYHATEAPLFSGIIVGQTIRTGYNQPATLVLNCSDAAVKMTLGRKSKFYAEKLDSQIITEVITAYGLEKTVEATTYTHPQLTQYQAVDWDFIITRAEANGMLAYAEDGKVFVKKPLASGTAGLVLTYGKDVLDFNLNVESRFQAKAAKHTSWDMGKQAQVSKTAAPPSLPSWGNLAGPKLAETIGDPSADWVTSSPLEAGELESWANANLLRSRLTAMTGTATFFGNATPKLNTLIQLAGFGERFNGTALITQVSHRIKAGRWETTVGFGVSPEWYTEQRPVSAPVAGGLLPGLRGLQIGTVKQLQEDPLNQHRILVALPLIDPAGPGTWARMANFYATSGKGAFFMPEVGDEVILGFVDNDPRYPVILGLLYSSANAAPYTVEAENKIKAIITKNDLKLLFDDEKKILTLETPAGNQIVCSDEAKSMLLKDQNGNQIEMAEAGITIKSAKDIILNAAGKVTVQAKQDITAKSAGGNFSAEALQVALKAKTSFSAQGNASAELKASGQTTVKGAMVMIN